MEKDRRKRKREKENGEKRELGKMKEFRELSVVFFYNDEKIKKIIDKKNEFTIYLEQEALVSTR